MAISFKHSNLRMLGTKEGNNVLKRVGLDHCQAYVDHELYRLSKTAIAELSTEYPYAHAIIRENVENIVYAKAENINFASTSFYDVPRTMILTDFSRYFIPPDVVLYGSSYGLKENIFHEALHLKLYRYSAKIPFLTRRGSILAYNIPWRNCEWSLMKIIHSYYVYSHLSVMRQFYTNELKKVRSNMSSQKASDCAGLLYQILLASWDVLTPKGRNFIKKINQHYEESFRK